jgi:hypothetical protein
MYAGRACMHVDNKPLGLHVLHLLALLVQNYKYTSHQDARVGGLYGAVDAREHARVLNVLVLLVQKYKY